MPDTQYQETVTFKRKSFNKNGEYTGMRMYNFNRANFMQALEETLNLLFNNAPHFSRESLSPGVAFKEEFEYAVNQCLFRIPFGIHMSLEEMQDKKITLEGIHIDASGYFYLLTFLAKYLKISRREITEGIVRLIGVHLHRFSEASPFSGEDEARDFELLLRDWNRHIGEIKDKKNPALIGLQTLFCYTCDLWAYSYVHNFFPYKEEFEGDQKITVEIPIDGKQFTTTAIEVDMCYLGPKESDT